MFDFDDKIVLITGAASGFGKLLAEKLYALGASLVLSDINEEAVHQVASDLGEDVIALRCDVSCEADVLAQVEVAVEKFGRVDIAVNNAGIAASFKSFTDISEADFDKMLSVNSKGVFFGMKAQLNQMKNQEGGSILNVSSMAGIGAAPKLAAYSAAKHAVIGLTKTAAVEFAKYNIRCNAICPFFSPTSLMTNNNMDQQQDFLGSASPMKRLPSPEEVVDVMISMIAPNNSYMNGLAIAVDGGISAY
jgi:NAD(P)-dependent dehydrogenase (short-subunit alcohol dehydrogenase family)